MIERVVRIDEDGLEHQIRVADKSLYDNDNAEGDKVSVY